MAPRDILLCPLDNQHRPLNAPIITTTFQQQPCCSDNDDAVDNVLPTSAAVKVKSVRFHPSCRVKVYCMRSRNDRKRSWYSPSDYQRFKNQNDHHHQKDMDNSAQDNEEQDGCRKTARQQPLGKDHHDDVDVVDDTLTHRVVELRIAQRNDAWDLVRHLQQDNDVSPETLGYLYGTLTSDSLMAAQQTALTLEAQLLWADSSTTIFGGASSSSALDPKQTRG